ncbi:bifunctional 2-polyprenyl-6-hydroxyphenol methylase/3-demethylubiquinol 3-O-methyltransferase UbiG [Rickettsiaceae bacterium]|nr:bifunctional 2-polyprenyl-6-hydroxyphenol methylase/3-demethylubiquinol 3-O-methyltransferase UbiG [Rickettsiaceae bacterium]
MQTSSIDKKELEKFNKTSKEWWHKDGEFQMLHEITPIRVEYINSVINNHFKTKSNKKLKLIDVGCGGGLISIPMCKLGFDVTALDPNETNVKNITSYAKDHNLNIKCIGNTVEEHIKTNPKYDIVLCLEVIEHVSNLEEFVQNLSKLVSDKGILVLSTINRNIKSYLQAIIVAEYILGWIPKKTHDHEKFVKPSKIVSILENTDLTLKELKGLSLSIPSQNWYISNDIDVNYFAVFQK